VNEEDSRFTVQVERRICRFSARLRLIRRILRNRWIDELDDLFGMATSIAKATLVSSKWR